MGGGGVYVKNLQWPNRMHLWYLVHLSLPAAQEATNMQLNLPEANKWELKAKTLEYKQQIMGVLIADLIIAVLKSYAFSVEFIVIIHMCV